MPFYTDEFLSAKPGEFEKKEFNIGADQSLETEVSESLNAFGIRGKVIGSESGPYITRVYFKLDRGVRFNSIAPLTEDLKMELRNPSIEIMADPERGAVAIEIPKRKPDSIPFGNVFHSEYGAMVLPMALGVDPKGNPVYLDMADIPHMLIAGATGAGKSVCLNSIITSLALNCRLTDLQFLLIDPKGTEFVQYENLKNLISGRIIDDVETALKSLTWLVEEMDRRYKIFKKCKCDSINEYIHKRNLGLNESASTCFVEDMPHIVVIIDEYADLMMNSANVLQENVKKLGNKARAAGIHLILATQRPSAKIVEGDIKANMTTRIALKMSSTTDSTTILNCGDAARLLGKGDMLLMRQDKGDLQRVHGCYTSKDVVKKAIELLPQKRLYRINEEDVFKNDIHDLHAQEDLKKHATWGELNAVSKIILEKFSEFMEGKRDTIYQVCASQFGMDKSRVDVAFSDVSSSLFDREFHQIALQSCLKDDENCGFPFVKSVIYSSPLIWKYKDGRHPFTDYILEQAFEKDDAAAMASVRFFCTIETYHLDYLKKRLDKLVEKGNEKVEEYLAEIKNKVVNELENEYCDDIEEYPNRDLFDRLLAEAHPPLMNFLLESGNTQYIIDAAENNTRIEDFVVEQALKDDSWKDFVFDELNNFTEKCVLRMAEKGDDGAIECVCNWDEYSLSDSAKETIFQLAVQDKDEAIKKVASWSRDYELDERFWELTENGRNKALEIICRYIEHGDYGSCDTYIVFELAKLGNERACKCIDCNYNAFEESVIEFIGSQNFADVKDFAEKINLFQHVDCREKNYAHFVCDMADEGNANAIELIYYNEKYKFFKEYIMTKADEADGDAWNCIRLHCYEDDCFEFYDYVKSCAIGDEGVGTLARELMFDHWFDFKKEILELAYRGDEAAKNAIYGAIHDSDDVYDEFREFIINDAQNGDGKSQKVAYDNPHCLFSEYILDEVKLGDDDAIDAIYSHPEVNAFHALILQRAKADDGDAMGCVYKHPENKDFQDVISKRASLGDEKSKKFIFANTKYELFQRYICELALHGDCAAKKVVQENPEIAPFQECICKLVSSNDENAKTVVLANVKYDLFKKCIVELAFQGDCGAKKVVLENPEIAPFQECICKLASSNDEDAKTVVLANVNYDLFQKCIVELTLQGDCDAKKTVLENHEINLFHERICRWALIGDANARKVVQINYGNYESFQKCMVDCALRGDACFAEIIYETIEKLQKKTDCALAKIFRGFIVSEARQNVERALKCVETDPQNEEYKVFLIEKCSERNEWALTIICNNSDYYRQWINKTIKSRFDRYNLKELLVEKILHLAKSDDDALKYVVCENPQEEKFKNLIVEKIQQNKDVFDCIYRYYLRQTSPCFGEFVKQRISKKFGVCYECDDETLKKAIRYSSDDYYKYFVLAAALSGNESALLAVRTFFDEFSSAIIKCLNSGEPQARKYIVECVNSDTVGKLIKELAIKGHSGAFRILQLSDFRKTK